MGNGLAVDSSTLKTWRDYPLEDTVMRSTNRNHFAIRTFLRGLRVYLSLALAAAVVICASVASADMIPLDEAAQGAGNMGVSFRPADLDGGSATFVLTARWSIDPAEPFIADALGQVGTVYIGAKGAGVQTDKPDGSKSISGGGGHKDDELIFTYDDPVYLDSIQITLEHINFGAGAGDKDDPVIFLSLAGTGLYGVTILESEILGAFTSTGQGAGTVDFGAFTSLAGDTGIDGFKVRETNDHIYVNGAAASLAIPEPAVLTMMAIGGVAMLRRRLA